MKQAFSFVTRSRFKRNSSPLTLTLDPGDYYFRVYGTPKATTYRLSATVNPTAIESPTDASGSDIPPTDASGFDTPPADVPGSVPLPSPTQPTTLKLNRSWIKQFGSAANDYLYGLALSSDGNQIYVSGSTNGNLLDPNTGNPVGTNAGDRDSFAAQFSSTGASQWVRQFGQPGLDAAYNIAVDASGNYFIPGINILSGLLPNPNGYLARFNASGTEQLPRTTIATQVPNPISSALPPINAGDAISSVAIDASGDLIVAGFVEAVPGNSTSKAWVARYDGATGVQEWNTELALPQSSGVSALKLDQSGNIYVTGITNATLTTDYTNPFQGGDAFVAKLSGNGTTLWQPQILSTVAYDEARDIAIDQNGNIYITGATQGTLAGQSSAGDTDGFLAKYDTNGILQWTKQFGSTGLDESQSIALDSAG
ncbi:MAG TPA: SBBP repeat-containing protein, partial [Allocoleopsis sp.]